MKKFLVVVLSILTMLCAIGLTACSCGGSTDNGTYYRYIGGDYDKTDYVVLDGSTMTDSDGASGTYEIKDGQIYLYVTVFGFQTRVSGTIKDGVMVIDGKTYCKEGCTPSTDNTNVKTQHTHNYIETIIPPTCTESGYTLEKCSICGDEILSNSVPATGAHNYVNGVCRVCGVTQQITDGSYFRFTLLVDDTYEIRVKDTNNLPSEVIIAPSYYGTQVTRIREEAFKNCTKMTSIIIPDSVTSIGNSAFSGCSSLTSVTIGNSVTSIGDYAFYGCESLTSVVIPDSVTSIGVQAFFECSRLKSVVIPDSVTSIGRWAFFNCGNLQYNEYDNGLYLGNNINPYVAIVGTRSTDIANCVIHKNTKIIISNTFENCKNIRNISIPDSVTSIGSNAFYGCSSLTSVTIGNSVTNIGTYAFDNCSSLTSIVIPDSVASIGDYAFRYCSSLTSITIPNSITSIGDSAFRSCGLRSISIPNGVTNIGTYAFYNCLSLTSIVIPDSVTSIGSYAFAGCSLISIIIPDSVTSIGERAFYGCESLTSVTIGNGVTSIEPYMFYYCRNLKNIIIGNGVINIGGYVFYEANSINNVVFNGTIEQWNIIRKTAGWNITNYETMYAHNEPLHLTIHCTDGDVTI